MAKIYKHLTTQGRAVIMTMRDDACFIRSIAERLCRSLDTISRELKRAAVGGVYDGNVAHIAYLRHHNQVRKPRSRADDRRYKIQDMQSIHIRLAEV
jgi:IS30 family transposase